MSLSFDVASFEPARFMSRSVVGTFDPHAPQGVRERVRYSEGGLFFVGVAEMPSGEHVGKVEWNPSRLVDPDGCSLATPDQARLSMHQAEAWVRERGVVPRHELARWRVKRLDVARDFAGVVSPSYFVRGLAQLKRAHARRSFVYNDPRSGNAETLFAGSGAGGVRLYDQHEAYADRGAAEGSMRWECEARAGWLSRVGITKVNTVTDERLSELLRERWEWSRMGVVVESAVGVVDAVEAMVCRHERGARGKRSCGCDGLSRPQADRMLGMLVREAYGLHRKMNDHTAADYNAFKRRLGLVMSPDDLPGLLAPEAAPVARRARLDLLAGAEVAA